MLKSSNWNIQILRGDFSNMAVFISQPVIECVYWWGATFWENNLFWTKCFMILWTPGWFHVKSPRKTQPFFFGFLTWKVKGISYFSNKNTFLDIFCWILTIFWFFKEISNFVKLDVDDNFFYFFSFCTRSTKKHIGHNIGLYFHNFV